MATPNKDAVELQTASLHHNTTYQSDLDDRFRLRTVSVGVGLEALAAEVGEMTLLIAEDAIELVSVAYYPDNALTTHNTNYKDLTIGKADGAGGAVTAFDNITTKITGTGDWVQGAPEAFTIVTATDTLTAGQALMFVKAIGGAGVVLPCGSIIVKYRLM